MSRLLLSLLLWTPLLAAAPPDSPGFWSRLHATIAGYLGRPYIWGASGLKSFDCSGFVWRVNYDNGVLLKRTTARKLYMLLPDVPRGRQWNFGTIVFFDNLKHCGIVNEQGSFYHAQTSRGTSLSQFDPYWRPLICGFRRIQP